MRGVLRGLEGGFNLSGKNRQEVILLVETHLFIDGPVQVNRESGNAHDRTIEVNQASVNLSINFDKDTASDSQIAIKPGVPDSSTIRDHSDLNVTFFRNLRGGLHVKNRRIRVGANDGVTTSRGPFLTDGEGDERGLLSVCLFVLSAQMAALSVAKKFLTFVNSSRSPFHAVATTKKQLDAAGYTQLHEKEPFNIEKGKKYYFTRNQSSLIAFAVGKKWAPGSGYSIIGAHTDSPVLHVKPTSKISKEGYVQVGVVPYGGGIWHTWFDRDLTVAGRVLVEIDGEIHARLVHLDRPIMRIPTLAIHLDRSVNEKMSFNKENHLLPILATEIKTTLESPKDSPHHSSFMAAIAAELDVDPSVIRNFELCVCDYQDAIIGGLNEEFIFSPRLDNLMSSFCALEALIAASTDESLENETSIRTVVMFDHEEVGSRSAYGAMSPLLKQAMERVSKSLAAGADPLPHLSTANSFLISADMAHAVHPNYADKHERNHRPAMHAGPVIKIHYEQRYATTSETSIVIEKLCQQRSIPFQKFVVRNDSPCGSTIGPICSSELGIRTVDIGGPQLSMHSIREMCGVDDTLHTVQLMQAFFEGFSELDKKIHVQ
eukprot:TRINITY_DN3640_c0_g1_i1.p1 TRINITY_DN3640_c0_g1~~TRINITY_DN3640_c0_g1_i1.p1  ORF type:complete len:602 (-),score=141.21 TRINITY_DN3640_c0_g1_i1:115-1920(-)